jgi:signal transduction histidine kinase/CHASE1-domain containing sensor protein/CheY-like chemotaxis protein
MTPQPRFPRWPRQGAAVAVTLVLALGSAFSFLAYRESQQSETARIETEFSRRADLREALNREAFAHFEGGLFSLRNVFIGSQEVTRLEFERSAREILARYPGIAALEWVARVPAAGRDAVEQHATQELGHPFQIIERDADGQLVRAGARAEYLPILFVAPLAGNERALGYDLATGSTRETLARARTTRQMVAMEPFRLVQDPVASDKGMVWTWPLFDANAPGEPFYGYVQMVFHVREMIGAVFGHEPSTALEALIIDPTETDPARRVFYFEPGRNLPAPHSLPTEAEFRRGLVRAYAFVVGTQNWQVLYRPQAAWLEEQQSPTPELLLWGGLLITGLLAVYVRAMLQRAAIVDRLVKEQTAELRVTQKLLEEDIRRRTEAERALQTSEQLYRAFVSQSTEGIWRFELREPIPIHLSEDEQLERIVAHSYLAECNDLMARLHGRTHAGELVGLSATEIFGPGLPLFREVCRASIRSGYRLVDYEIQMPGPDGQVRFFLLNLVGFCENDRLVRSWGGQREITERKKAEAERVAMERKLLETQKLESLGVLAGGIAHDFNNLLTGIVGNAGLVRLDLPPDSPLAAHIRQIESAALRAAELCQQLLAYAGKGRFLVESLDLNELIEGTLALLRLSIGKQAQLQLALTRPLPLVMADTTQIRQIVMNLVINAADAIGARPGVVTLRTGSRFVRATEFAAWAADLGLPEGDYVFLEIGDTGCGMPPEALRRIFEPFFTTKFAGRGLGLAAVLGIVRGHRGALRVTSELGRGSVFTLFLPATGDPVAVEPGVQPERAAWQHSGTALMVDDEECVRTVTERVLTTFGFDTVAVGDGEAALAIFVADPDRFDVVLLDLVMPGLSGKQVLARLRQIRPKQRVLLVSGYSGNDAASPFVSDGFTVFLQKPYTREVLERKLRDLWEDT